MVLDHLCVAGRLAVAATSVRLRSACVEDPICAAVGWSVLGAGVTGTHWRQWRWPDANHPKPTLVVRPVAAGQGRAIFDIRHAVQTLDVAWHGWEADKSGGSDFLAWVDHLLAAHPPDEELADLADYRSCRHHGVSKDAMERLWGIRRGGTLLEFNCQRWFEGPAGYQQLMCDVWAVLKVAFLCLESLDAQASGLMEGELGHASGVAHPLLPRAKIHKHLATRAGTRGRRRAFCCSWCREAPGAAAMTRGDIALPSQLAEPRAINCGQLPHVSTKRGVRAHPTTSVANRVCVLFVKSGIFASYGKRYGKTGHPTNVANQIFEPSYWCARYRSNRIIWRWFPGGSHFSIGRPYHWRVGRRLCISERFANRICLQLCLNGGQTPKSGRSQTNTRCVDDRTGVSRSDISEQAVASGR